MSGANMIAQSITVPRNTPQQTPIRVDVSLTLPAITDIYCKFPNGVCSFTFVRIMSHGSQIWPVVGWETGNNQSKEWHGRVEIVGDRKITIEGYSIDDTFGHTPRFSIVQGW